MTGPSLWRLSSPRGGVTSVTVSGSTIEPVGSIIVFSVPPTTIQRGPETSSSGVTLESPRGNARGSAMNLTLVGAIVLLAVWMIVVFVAHVGSGPVHLLYAGGMILVARRIALS